MVLGEHGQTSAASTLSRGRYPGCRGADRYVVVVPAERPVAGSQPIPWPERYGTDRTGGEVPGGLRLQPDLRPYRHRARDLGALGQRQSGILRGPEYKP